MCKNFLFKLLVTSLIAVAALCFFACGNSVFNSDAEMQVTVRGAYASIDNVNINRGYFLVVEDDNICDVSFPNGLLGQDSDPIYTTIPIEHPITKRDYKTGKIIADTKTYLCQDVDTTTLSTKISSDKYTYTKLKEAGNIKIQNSEPFYVINTNVKNSVFNTKIYSGSFSSNISTNAVFLKYYFYDENYDTIQTIKYYYCYQVAENSITSFEVELESSVDTNACTIIAYYL